MSKTRTAKRRKRAKSKPVRQQRERIVYGRQEVADMLGLSKRTIIRMDKAGMLSGVKLGPNQNSPVRYPVADIHKLAGVEVA